jgi:hypothetical protein
MQKPKNAGDQIVTSEDKIGAIRAAIRGTQNSQLNGEDLGFDSNCWRLLNSKHQWFLK